MLLLLFCECMVFLGGSEYVLNNCVLLIVYIYIDPITIVGGVGTGLTQLYICICVCSMEDLNLQAPYVVDHHCFRDFLWCMF